MIIKLKEKKTGYQDKQGTQCLCPVLNSANGLMLKATKVSIGPGTIRKTQALLASRYSKDYVWNSKHCFLAGLNDQIF